MWKIAKSRKSVISCLAGLLKGITSDTRSVGYVLCLVAGKTEWVTYISLSQLISILEKKMASFWDDDDTQLPLHHLLLVESFGHLLYHYYFIRCVGEKSGMDVGKCFLDNV